MRRLLAALIVVTTGLACLTQAQAAEVRVALVIGNGAYQNAPRLPNPPNDATDVASALKREGFDTILATDLDKAGMEEATIRFARAARAARSADVAMFYYSGHAVQFGGVNYLAPVDAKLNDETDLRRMARVDDIVSDLQQAKNLRILVLDSCRDNPLADQLRRSIGTTRAMPLQRGLAKIDTPLGMIVAYATQAGRTAEDGTGRNSPYTTAFLKNIEAQEEIGVVFRRISNDVYQSTGRTQLPELSLSLTGEFYLKGKVEITIKPEGAVPPATQPVDPAERAWIATQNTTSVAVLEDFIRQFGDTLYGSMARARLEELRKQVAVVAPPIRSPAPFDPCNASAVTASLKSRAACPLSTAEERKLKPKDSFKECDTCPEMVVVPSGSFTMGSPDVEKPNFYVDIVPHQVTFSQSFAVGRFAVTFEEWDACVAEGGCDAANFPEDMGWGRRRRPVINVSWDDANTYLQWLSRKTGKTYRLPSEAEREYVTRAGTTTKYWWGNSISTQQANYNGRDETYGDGSKGEFRTKTMPVDSFKPNPWGLYQVHGNVYEWVQDCPYSGESTDGSVRMSKSCSDYRNLRGGSWASLANELRAANVFTTYPKARISNIEFRVARTLATP